MQLAALLVEESTKAPPQADNINTNQLHLQWSQSAKAAAAKIVMTQVEVLARDLEAFARYEYFRGIHNN